MATQLFFQKNHSDLADWTATTGSIAWISQGLNGTYGAMAVTFDGAEASVTQDFTSISPSQNFNLGWHLAQRTTALVAGASAVIAGVYRNSGADLKLSVTIKNVAGEMRLYISAVDDDGVTTTEDYTVLTDPWPRYLEIASGEASNGSSNDGYAALRADGVEVARAAGLDLFTHFDFDRVKIGRISVTGTEPTGVLHLDEVKAEHGNTGAYAIGASPMPSRLPVLKETLNLPRVILPGRSTHYWEVRLSNLGGLWLQPPVAGRFTSSVLASEVVPLGKRQLLDTSSTSVWRLRVDDSVADAPILEAVDQGTTNAQHSHEMLLHSSNGREWKVTVSSAGVLSATALSALWPALGQPRLTVGTRIATFQVTDAGLISVVDTPMHPTKLHAFVIRAQDDSSAWTVTVDADLLVSTANDAILADTLYYDFEVESANGTHWRIQIDGDGTLSAWSVEAFNATRYGNTVALDSRGNLVVIDPRFKRAGGYKSGWGWNRRTFRGGKA